MAASCQVVLGRRCFTTNRGSLQETLAEHPRSWKNELLSTAGIAGIAARKFGNKNDKQMKINKLKQRSMRVAR